MPSSLRQRSLALWFALSLPAVLSAQQARVKSNGNLRPHPSNAPPAIRLLKPPETLTLLEPNPTQGYYHVVAALNDSGWVWHTKLTFVVADPPGPPLPPPGAFAISHASCPPVGKHKVNNQLVQYSETSDAGLRNMAKRHSPVGATPVTLTLADILALQQDVSSRFSDAHLAKTSFEPDRSALQNRPLGTATISEGDLVQLAAFLIEVRPQGNESTNCAGQDGSDIHLSIGAKNTTEWESVVAEIIPQLDHPVGWDATTLRKLRDQKLQVLVIGGLSYDNEHLVNDDPAHPNGTQPKRISLWEIHPITAFYVCELASCSPGNHSQWTTLTTWAKAQLP
jgi:hypothetical protein